MSPLMKVAMAFAEALISSWALDTFNLAIISSRAFIDLEFSDLTASAEFEAVGAIFGREYGRKLATKFRKEGGGEAALDNGGAENFAVKKIDANLSGVSKRHNHEEDTRRLYATRPSTHKERGLGQPGGRVRRDGQSHCGQWAFYLLVGGFVLRNFWARA